MASSKALCTQVARKEWGFQGQEETDGVVGGAYKYHFASSLSAGTTTYCIDPMGDAAAGILKIIRSTDDGYLQLCLRDAVKNYHYALVNSNLTNGMSVNSTIKTILPWWQIALYAADAVLALLTVIFLAAMLLSGRKKETIQVEEGGK